MTTLNRGTVPCSKFWQLRGVLILKKKVWFLVFYFYKKSVFLQGEIGGLK